jgi:hypothetical protein
MKKAMKQNTNSSAASSVHEARKNTENIRSVGGRHSIVWLGSSPSLL